MTICVFYRPICKIQQIIFQKSRPTSGTDFKLWPQIGIDNKTKTAKCQVQSSLGQNFAHRSVFYTPTQLIFFFCENILSRSIFGPNFKSSASVDLEIWKDHESYFTDRSVKYTYGHVTNCFCQESNNTVSLAIQTNSKTLPLFLKYQYL